MTLWVKICGLTREEDVDAVAAAGADAIGLNLWPRSSRAVDLESARELAARGRPSLVPVAVFVDADAEAIREALAVTGIEWAQLHGDEPPELADELVAAGVRVIKAVTLTTPDDLERAEQYRVEWTLADAGTPSRPGGTGRVGDWALASELARRRPTLLAGGLRPENVHEAVREVRPAGVDVASGVESAPGLKDADAVRELVQRAREAAR